MSPSHAPPRDRFPNASETVLVTGASSGIGRELAHCFAEDGSDCVLLARSEEALHALAQEVDDGEARTIAIAFHREWAVGTDDKKTLRVCRSEDIDRPDVTTPELMRHWADRANPPREEVAEALGKIQTRAVYLVFTSLKQPGIRLVGASFGELASYQRGPNCEVCPAEASSPDSPGLGISSRPLHRAQCEGEGASVPGRRVDPDAPTVRLDDLLADDGPRPVPGGLSGRRGQGATAPGVDVSQQGELPSSEL